MATRARGKGFINKATVLVYVADKNENKKHLHNTFFGPIFATKCNKILALIGSVHEVNLVSSSMFFLSLPKFDKFAQ